jgi:aldehyde:ferredoxin oxidoreductase
MKTIRIEDYLLEGEDPAYVTVPPESERALRDAVAYCSFIADEFDTAITPRQMAELMQRFYGFKWATQAPSEELDISMERKLYHVKGRPLPMKSVLMASKTLARDGLRDAVERLASINEAGE